MQLGIFAKTFPEVGALPVLRAVRAAGYDVTQFNLSCVGLPSLPDALDSTVVQEVAQASAEMGISIAALSGTYNMAHPDAAVRDQGLRRLDVLMRHAPALGTRLITLCSGTRDPDDQWAYHPDNATAEAWTVMSREMARAAELAQRYGIDLGIEPEMTNVVSSARKARELLDTLGSPRLKIVLDPANLFEHGDTALSRERTREAVDLLGNDLAMAHAKDRRADGRFTFPGDGVVDFPDFVALLRGAGFQGPLVTHGLSAAEAPGVAQFLRGLLT